MSKTDNYIIDLHNKDVEIQDLKEERKTVYETACELVEYLEENDYEIDPETIGEYIATIQNYSK